ncbi:hypothetical protein [Syntrophomonas curvata]
MAENTDIEIMRKFIAGKKEKSASQGSIRRGPQDRFGTTKARKNKNKKSALAPAANTEPEGEA